MRRPGSRPIPRPGDYDPLNPPGLGHVGSAAAIFQIVQVVGVTLGRMPVAAGLALGLGAALMATSCGLIQVPQGLPFLRGGGSGPPSPGPTALPTIPPASTLVPGSLPDPGPYALVQTEDVSDPHRVRFQSDIVLLTEPTREELIASLADAVRVTFEEHPDAEAVVVFAFPRPETVRRTFDTGRALASRDRRGWRGESSWVPFVRLPDRGKIHITLGSALTQVEHVEADFEGLQLLRRANP